VHRLSHDGDRHQQCRRKAGTVNEPMCAPRAREYGTSWSMGAHHDHSEDCYHRATFLSGRVSNNQITAILYQAGHTDIQKDINLEM
jgi:hypothetical protein